MESLWESWLEGNFEEEKEAARARLSEKEDRVWREQESVREISPLLIGQHLARGVVVGTLLAVHVLRVLRDGHVGLVRIRDHVVLVVGPIFLARLYQDAAVESVRLLVGDGGLVKHHVSGLRDCDVVLRMQSAVRRERVG